MTVRTKIHRLRMVFHVMATACLLKLAPGTPVWAQEEPLNVIWQEKIEIATGGGLRGPWRMNRSVYDYVDDPSVAINGNGIVGVTWVDQARKDVLLQVFDSAGNARFDRPINVSGTPKVFSWLPRILIGSGDARDIFVLWQEIVFSGGSHGGEILFARSGNGGATFETPVNLSNSIFGDGKGRLTARYWDNGSLDLAAGDEHQLYAAWTDYDGNLWFSRSTDSGKSFSGPLRVSAASHTQPARAPSLGVDGTGQIYLAWTIGEDERADIRIAVSGDHGRTFGEARPVLASGGHADAPKVVVDREGTLHLVYAESPTGPFARYRIIYSRSYDGGRTFEPPRELSDLENRRFSSAGFPAIALDDEDRIYVTWELFPRPRTRSQGLGFTYSADMGSTFAQPSVVRGSDDRALGFNGSQQGLLMRKLAATGDGSLAAVNSVFREGEASRIHLIRGHASERSSGSQE